MKVDTDTDADTVTIRNIRLSPFSGTGETPDAPGAEFDSQVIALWASDGATATQGEVMIWDRQWWSGSSVYPRRAPAC